MFDFSMMEKWMTAASCDGCKETQKLWHKSIIIMLALSLSLGAIP
jgi:hypothetical protein